MSWFKRSGERKSTSPSNRCVETDPNTCLEVFQNHWKQACTVILLQDRKVISTNGLATSDGMELVMHNVESMITLLVNEEDDGGMPGPILRYVIDSELLDTFCNWCSVNVHAHERLRIRHLRLFEAIISQSHQLLLMHKNVIRPLLKLLMEVAESSEINNGELEFKLVLLLHQICICISQQGLILESFFSTDTDHGPARFLIFSLLIPFIHIEGPVGQKARDALLLIMTLSNRHPHIGQYIANNSHFCAVLATGLNGLYSSLPRRIPMPSDDWHTILKEDCVKIPELQMFLNSLQFSNAVVQVAHPLVRDQLIHYVYTGFLLPVLAPALHQISREEIATATAYLDVFIRHVTDPHLLKAFLQFILVEKFDDIVILDSLISRLGSNSVLSTVTLSLFYTLVDLNCEDIMFKLVLRYLVPCTHVMVSQRRSVRDLDLFGKSAEKFLSLRPSCCTGKQTEFVINPNVKNRSMSIMNKSSQNKSQSQVIYDVVSLSESLSESESSSGFISETSFFDYLHEARLNLHQVEAACKNWKHLYDGENPPPDSLENLDKSVMKGKEDRQEENIGFHEVGSFPSNQQLKSIDQINSKEEVTNKEEGFTDVSHTNQVENVVTTPSKDSDDNNSNSDTIIKPNLKDLDTFLQYLEGLEGDVSDSGNVSTSLISLDNLINSLSIPMSSRSNSTSSEVAFPNRDTSPLQVNLSSLSPILGNTTEFSFISHSELTPQRGDKVLESSANTNSRDADMNNPCFENTAFENVSMSEVTSKQFKVHVTDASSFVNISLVPNDSHSNTNSKKLDQNKELRNSLSLFKNNEGIEFGTPKSEKKMPRDFKYKFNPRGSTGLMSPTLEDLPAFTSSSPRRHLRYLNQPPNIGPFLTALFSGLESMVTNTASFNLLLTGTLVRLAAYPQPLLRSFLLNHNLVFQPSVKSLIQVLSILKQKLETCCIQDKQFDRRVTDLKESLLQIGELTGDSLQKTNTPVKNTRAFTISNQHTQQPPPKLRSESMTISTEKDKKKTNLADLFFRRSGLDKRGKGKSSNRLPQLQKVSGGTGYIYIKDCDLNDSGLDGEESNSRESFWNPAFCALIFDEFLKELAALSQEHSVLCLDEGYISLSS